jgi:hypothetical protein
MRNDRRAPVRNDHDLQSIAEREALRPRHLARIGVQRERKR